MKYIVIIFLSFFTLNFSFCQMKVYACSDNSNRVLMGNSNLVGIITESGEVYSYLDGGNDLLGTIVNNKLILSNGKVAAGYSNVPTMGGGGMIYIGSSSSEKSGFRFGVNFFLGDNIEDKSNKIGFCVGGDSYFFKAGEGRYAAAFLLLFAYHYSR
jgi:hypothetical protein